MSLPDDVFEEGRNGKKSLRVFHINPPLEDPWRTHKDYKEEQQEARDRHENLMQQHQIIQKSFFWNKVVAIAAIITAAATLFIAYYAYTEINLMRTEIQNSKIQSTP
jgi:hypothetical protein